MTSRERVVETINHRIPDRVPIDLGGTHLTSFSATAYQNFRDYHGLEKKPCDVICMLMMTAKVDDDAREVMGVDTTYLSYPVDATGCRLDRVKPFRLNDGTDIYVGASNQWDYLDDGSVVLYPRGDKTVAPSMIMVPGGDYFSNIDARLEPWDEDDSDPRGDFKNDFLLISDWAARYLEEESIRLYNDTDYAVIGYVPFAGLGDAGVLPGSYIKHPKGPRKLDDFLAANLMYPEYLDEVFAMQTEVALKNLEIYKQAVGDRIQVILVGAADYGTQAGQLISPDTFRELYKPHYKELNDWIHANTSWKTMYHSCGNISAFIDDFIDMGCDILNPIQLSAGMDAQELKDKYGDRLVFWGAGADSQGALTFGTPDDVRAQVRERLEIFSPGGGYVFNTVHNIMPKTKIENIMAMLDEVHAFNDALQKL